MRCRHFRAVFAIERRYCESSMQTALLSSINRFECISEAISFFFLAPTKRNYSNYEAVIEYFFFLQAV